MRSANIKDRCTKKKLKKSDEVIRTYDKIQTAYAEILDANPNIQSIRCNVPLEKMEEGPRNRGGSPAAHRALHCAYGCRCRRT